MCVTGLFSRPDSKASMYEQVCTGAHGFSAGCRVVRGRCGWCPGCCVFPALLPESYISRTLHENSSDSSRQIGLERQPSLFASLCSRLIHAPVASRRPVVSTFPTQHNVPFCVTALPFLNSKPAAVPPQGGWATVWRSPASDDGSKKPNLRCLAPRRPKGILVWPRESPFRLGHQRSGVSMVSGGLTPKRESDLESVLCVGTEEEHPEEGVRPSAVCLHLCTAGP